MLAQESVTLPKGQELREPLRIVASHVTVDGNGARIVGPGRKGDRASFQGVGIAAAGCVNVILRNIVVSGFETGIDVSDGVGWAIENCDASDNYADEEFGWGEYKRVGGIVLTRMRACVIRGNVAERNWNGLDLCECSDNLIENNRFAHSTNVCLRMDRSSRNIVLENDLSYGIRLKPDEIHARDSTGVLVESGSDHNFFCRNDVRHGGDGIFVRALSGWVSSNNVFIENDCSHAHNNGIEAWAPGNVYVRNRTNHCSFGFWLGGSDGVLLIGNEAGWCSPQGGQRGLPCSDFGHGGIVGLSGFADGVVADGNHCHDNEGAGFIIGGSLKEDEPDKRVRHWILQANRLERNQRAVWVRRADSIELRGNRAGDNLKPDVFEETRHVSTVEPGDRAQGSRPAARIRGPMRAVVGEQVVFDGSLSSDPRGAALEHVWDAAGSPVTGNPLTHVFGKPGPCAVTLTVRNRAWASLTAQNVYVADAHEDPATEESWSSWSWDLRDPRGNPQHVVADADSDCVAGRLSLRVRASGCAGAVLTGSLPLRGESAAAVARNCELRFWLKTQNPNVTEYKGPNPIVRLAGPDGSLSYTPIRADGKPRNLLLEAPFGHARRIWQYVVVPLAGGTGWRREETGDPDPRATTTLILRFEEPASEPWTFWLDGLLFA